MNLDSKFTDNANGNVIPFPLYRSRNLSMDETALLTGFVHKTRPEMSLGRLQVQRQICFEDLDRMETVITSRHTNRYPGRQEVSTVDFLYGLGSIKTGLPNERNAPLFLGEPSLGIWHVELPGLQVPDDDIILLPEARVPCFPDDDEHDEYFAPNDIKWIPHRNIHFTYEPMTVELIYMLNGFFLTPMDDAV